MKSVKCPECGFVGWADAERCKKCGVIRLPDPGGDAYETSSQYAGYQPSYGYYPPKLKTGLAVAALVIGILDLFTLGLLGVGSVLGITLSIVALRKAKRQPDEYGGQSLATAGLVMSILSAVMIVPLAIISAIAIPNLLAARRAANEGASIHALRKIHSAEATYQSTSGNGDFGTLDQLIAEELVTKELSDGKHYGYKFTVRLKSPVFDEPAGFEAMAVPETYGSSGMRSFYVDETGVIRWANNRGLPASEMDAPFDDETRYTRTPPQRYNYRDY